LIDEVQRLPSVLNSIQAILDEWKSPPKFYLTGSSARKLKRGQANLLPGRLISYFFFPLTMHELGDQFDLSQALSTGTLPGIFSEKDPEIKKQILGSYAGTYLKEEVQAEALTKNIEGFSRFIFVAAAKNGEFLDFAKIGVQAHITQKTASRFFEILEDTLVVYRLLAYSSNDATRLIKHPKYYFFDTGVLNALLGNFYVSQDRIGNLFETFVVTQIIGLTGAFGKLVRLSTYRTNTGAEVDLVLEFEDQIVAIEIKASQNVGKSDLRGLASFSEFIRKPHKSWVIYLGKYSQVLDEVRILPLDVAMKELSSLFS
jgi:predicted AAA+ superfamily ATPase